MPYQERRTTTRTEIIKLAAEWFTTKGYNGTLVPKLAKELNIRQGNVTFYFPTKEDLFAIVVDELCDFQRKLMEKEVGEGYSEMMSYCLEITSMAAICEEDDVTRDFFYAVYTLPTALNIVRDNDTERAKQIFKEYQPDWSDERWISAENIVSGIEYATIITKEVRTPLDIQIQDGLNAILTIYGVPEELRKIKIEKVLNMDYRALGRRILKEFRTYVRKFNDEALRKAKQFKPSNPWKTKK